MIHISFKINIYHFMKYQFLIHLFYYKNISHFQKYSMNEKAEMKKRTQNVKNENNFWAKQIHFIVLWHRQYNFQHYQRIALLTDVEKKESKLLENILLSFWKKLYWKLCVLMLSITCAFPIPVINIVLKRKDWNKSLWKTFPPFLYIYNIMKEQKYTKIKGFQFSHIYVLFLVYIIQYVSYFENVNILESQ